VSLDLLGAEAAPRGVLIRVRNAQALAASQGGTAGAIASSLVPQTIEGVVLDKMAEEFRKNLVKSGVDADVSIVSTDPLRPAKSGLVDCVLLGVGGSALAWIGWHFGLSRFLK
jgi:hypothetical protein